jgi:nucleoside-diphosphate-sugar epimerase
MERMPNSLKGIVGDLGTTVGGIDVCDADALNELFQEHADENTTVWNLAAPLSVETAMDPAVAEAVTVGGMGKVLDAMSKVGARRICFTDSIGSFGSEAPRRGATARWLTENPGQDPGSDYGRQKRGCRELMESFARDHGGDPRFAVLPGVLHSEPIWGNGTTEYALDAILAAPHQETRHGLPTVGPYVCPVDPDVRMPMVFVDDLMRGLIALQEADEQLLTEPQHGYCVPGLSFTPNELFAEIRKHHPGFEFTVDLNENMNNFAHLWPDELSTIEPLRDLGYAPEVGLSNMVSKVLASHEKRNEDVALQFKMIDAAENGRLNRQEVEMYFRYLIRGREDYGHRRKDAVADAVTAIFSELDTNRDGWISWGSFSEWNRRNSVERIAEEVLQDAREQRSFKQWAVKHQRVVDKKDRRIQLLEDQVDFLQKKMKEQEQEMQQQANDRHTE